MKTITEHIRERLLTNALIFPYKKDIKTEHQFSASFRYGRDCRMIMGGYRYGNIRDAGSRVHPRIRTNSMIKRIKRYIETGNTEYLMDVANLAEIEFIASTHPNKHFHAVDGAEAELTRVEY